ncbi:MAG TPA: Fic family protein [Candidatus Binatia bacterium]|jgi:hypothetical protein|nr:Fic family protein [Candidatus Binatia bacterium]
MPIDKTTADGGPMPPDPDRDTVPETPDAKRDAAQPVEAKLPPEGEGVPAPNRPLLDAIMETEDERGMPVSAEVQLEIIASYDGSRMNEAAGDVAFLAEDYGLAPGDLDAASRDKLAVLWLGIKDARSERSQEAMAERMEYELREGLTRAAYGKIERLTADVRRNLRAADLEDRLRSVMETVGRLGGQFPLDEEHELEWKDLTDKFRGLVALREGSEETVQQAFEKVFQENESVVEDGLAAAYLQRKGGDVEKNLMVLYGRSREEQEKIKARNRAEAAEVVRDLADKPLDFAALERLHQANNRNIVPKAVSKVRAEGMPPTFFERIGLLPEDLKVELDEVLRQANELRAAEIGDGPGKMTKEAYAARAAQLHNDFLDMHPFSDRNGSTALLFLETMMTKAGYEPPKERTRAAEEGDPKGSAQQRFLEDVTRILGGDHAAMAILYEGQARMKEPGYFVGASNKSDTKRDWYDRVLNMHRSAAGKPRHRREGAKEEEE